MLDADLEYDPQDIPKLLDPVLDGRATVVYGNRTFGSHSAYSFWYVMGNKAVTTAANVLFNSYIGDLETCFKLLPVALYRSLDVRSRGFGMEAEVTGKLLRRRIRPYEVPISYRARGREEGKKITWKDGVEALWILGRERARRRDGQLRNPLIDARSPAASSPCHRAWSAGLPYRRRSVRPTPRRQQPVRVRPRSASATTALDVPAR